MISTCEHSNSEMTVATAAPRRADAVVCGYRSCTAARLLVSFVPVLLSAALICPPQPALAQFTQQGPKLFATDAVGSQPQQGASIALSGDGNTAALGAPNEPSVGAAWVFTRSGGAWSEQAKLVGTNAVSNSQQGRSIALSRDGNTAIVGGPGDSSNAGAAWVFVRSGATWNQQAKLVGTGAVGHAEQGKSVALSADGNTAIVGGSLDNSAIGAAWVFTRNGGTWSQQAKLVGNGTIGAVVQQGFSAALSADGNTAIVGGFQDNSNAGAAWVFTRSGGALWSQQAKLVGNGAVGAAEQGFSVALSADGDTAIVGGPCDRNSPSNCATPGPGAAWVFIRSGGQWTQQGNKLAGSDAVGNAEQGVSVALSGNTAIVGGSGDNSGVGAMWVYTRGGGVWTQQGSKLVGSGASGAATQGSSAALSCNTAIIGGINDNTLFGAAWVFVKPPTATHDFSADCLSDILWYNTASGQVVNWLVRGTSVLEGGSPGSAPSPWATVGQRDFNGDGFADILWRNGSTGQTIVWLLNGTSVSGTGSPGTVTTDWIVAGTGDFNGDGMGDVLWYNPASGQVVLWFLNGSSVIGGGSPGSAPSPFTMAGTGDFNGDGRSDIVWYNTSTGQAVIWFLNGAAAAGGCSPGTAPSPFTIGGTGDFNGDGKSDILWYNTSTGQVVLWLLNGTSVIGGGSPGSAGSRFAIVETGDFSGDGKSDILWYNNATGQVVLWFLDGAALVGGGSPGSGSPPFQLQGMNAD